MNLRAAILQVRLGLDAVTDQFWTDAEIIAWLNEGAQLMCSLAQVLIGAAQFPSVANLQEYLLPEDTDEVDAVSYNNGTQLPMITVQQAWAQRGNRAGGTPAAYYLRVSTMQLMNHGGPTAPSTADIAITNIQQPTRKPRKVIGFYPVPMLGGQNITVTYYQRHYMLVNDTDEFAIPDEFQRGLIDYAVAKGKIKESAYAEADKFMASFKDYSQRLVEKWQNNGQEQGFQRMRIRGMGQDSRMFGGTSWVNLYVGDV